MSSEKPIKVAVIGGGCASMAAAFELTRPEHGGKYHVTVYQLGWRLGGKAHSGRGPADRIEEHGLHVWLGFYENAFRLLRECYAELDRDPRERFADWREAIYPDPVAGLADISPSGRWLHWMASYPQTEGIPGDPPAARPPMSVGGYLRRAAALLRTVLESVQLREKGSGDEHPRRAGDPEIQPPAPEAVVERIQRLLRYAQLSTMTAVIEGVRLLETVLGEAGRYPGNLVLRLIEAIAAGARSRLEGMTRRDEEIRRLWAMTDLALSILRGAARFGLATDPRGFDAVNDYDFREWLVANGASEGTIDSAFIRGLYDLSFAFEDGDPGKPRLAAGQALRTIARMFFTYRGSFFWKMRGSMGDIVFAPYYQLLVRRGVRFEFFHRLENVKLADPANLAPGERPYVEALELDVQARVKGGGPYQPLIDVRGLPCWPSAPDYRQLAYGKRYEGDGRDFESFWDQRKGGTKRLRVSEDFDFVVLGVGIGAIPHVCREIVARDERWRLMVEHVKTAATQAFQIWMNEDMSELGWKGPPINMTGFVEPFDAWVDTAQTIPEESWPIAPRAVAYFCSTLPTPARLPDRSRASYPAEQRERVRQSAIRFLNRDIAHFWPAGGRRPDVFRWELLVDPAETEPPDAAEADESRFASQFWVAAVNPSDRFVLALPGSQEYRISPLDNTYDNLVITGDWTNCGFNVGCVEAATMSGRLAAHAIAQSPPLQEIIGFDHP